MNQSKLSKLLDAAIELEEYHRDQLLFWKWERQRLEQQIQSPVSELLEIAAETWEQTK